MIRHIPTPEPLSDIVSWGGDMPTHLSIIKFLGFDETGTEKASRKGFLYKKETKYTHKHNSHEGIYMVMYTWSDEVYFYKNDILIYTSKTLHDCHVKRREILREINLCILI